MTSGLQSAELIAKNFGRVDYAEGDSAGFSYRDGGDTEDGEMLEKYDFSEGLRSQCFTAHPKGTNVVLLGDDVAEAFPDAESVNRALRLVIELRKTWRTARRAQDRNRTVRAMRGTHASLPDPRNETVQVYINGAFFPRQDAKISVFDSGFLVGDGVWEGVRLHNGRFAFLDLHLTRLFEGAKAIGLELPHSKADFEAALFETVRRNAMHTDVHVRLMVTRGTKKTPSQDPRLVVGGPNVVIIAEHKRADPEVTAAGVRLFTSAVRRPPPDTLDQKLNCHSKLHEVVALVQALAAGADEALMLDPEGFVATCNATNFFIVRRGEVWTSTGQYCLNGITRRLVLELARAEGIPALEKPFSLTDVYSADEAFVTGTFGSLTPVIAVDGRTVGEGNGFGPVTARLSALYKQAVADVTA